MFLRGGFNLLSPWIGTLPGQSRKIIVNGVFAYPGITYTRAGTATYYDSAGVMQLASANTPRISYHPATLQLLGYLSEAAQNNACLQSNAIQTSPWADSLVAPVITANDAVAPDGTTTMCKVDDQSLVARTSRLQTVTCANDSNGRTVSVHVKKKAVADFPSILMAYSGGTPISSEVRLNTLTGAVQISAGTGTALVEDCGSWWRFGVNLANNASGNITLQWDLIPQAAATIGGADDITLTGFQHFWGLQCEGVSGGTNASSGMTSLKPTTTAGATRQMDNAQLTLGGWFNSLEGTIVAETFVRQEISSLARNLWQLATDASNFIGNRLRAGNSNYQGFSNVAAVQQVNIFGGTIVPEQFQKSAYAFKLNDSAVFVGGAQIGATDVACTIPAVTTLYIGRDVSAAGANLFGYIKNLTYYGTRKVDAVAASLTL